MPAPVQGRGINRDSGGNKMNDIRISTMGVCEHRNGTETRYVLQYPFRFSDGGRSLSKRPRQKNDCTVRAVAIAREMDYDSAYDLLADAGRKCARGFHLPEWLNDQSWAVKIPFQARKGEHRMNPATFCESYTDGRYICRTAKHVFAVIDGVLIDSWEQRPDRCIYTAWKIS